MTSSLVGSEMCIRDRLSTSQSKQAPGRGPHGPQYRCACYKAVGRTHAVSYTHLTLPTICSV
eukprot:8860964-Prorocentrum_lima.AAC.1